MKAAILTGFKRPFEIADDVEIDSPAAGELLVGVTHCGVCHSDLTVVAGADPNYPLPVILGHEAAGVVASVGGGVTTLAEGQPVVLSMRAPCGGCHYCTRGLPVLCETTAAGRLATRVRWRGAPVTRGFGIGAFAEYVLVDAAAAVPLGAATPRDVASIIGCAVQTGVGAVTNLTSMSPGASALVIGAGTVGICVILGAKLTGAVTIIAIDPNPARREQALALGASHTFDSAAPNLVEQVKALTAGRGVDFAFDVVGRAETPELAIACLSAGGHAVVIGVTSLATKFSVPAASFAMQQKTVSGCMLGNCHPQRDFPRFVSLWQNGRLALDRLVTAVRPLAEIDAAMADLAAGLGLRTVLAI